MRHFVSLFAALLTATGAATTALASVDSGLLAYVPASAKVVASVDITHTRNSQFGQYLLGKAQAGDTHFQDMINEMGFDPRRDLQTVIFATSGGGSPAFAILARGNFDPNKIKAFATGKGKAKIQNYGGVDLLVEPRSGARQAAVAFLDTGVAAMADITTLKQIIDGRAAPPALDADLAAKINTVGASNDAWFVSLVNGANWPMNGGTQSNNPQAKALQGVVQASGGVKFGANLETTMDAVTRSPQDAVSLTDVARFLGSMVQMQRQNDPKAEIVAKAIDGMKLENSGTNVHFAITMPEKSLEQLMDSAAPVAMNGH